MIRATEDQEYYELSSPTALPKASGFLWNEQMMVHMNCRGYAVAQFMQPEPAKYSHAPNLEAKTFMQPEQPYYAHHPGRFLYVKDEESGALFSAPYEPVRVLPDQYTFAIGKHQLVWKLEHNGIGVEMSLSLPRVDAMELWRVRVTNLSGQKRNLSIYPYFTVGYMSWMNQSGEYNEALQAVVCSSITPYQKYQEYDRIKRLKDRTFLLADRQPTAWEVNNEAFEGEGGISAPSAILQERLSKGEARYETPVAVLQYSLSLEPGEEQEYRFLFGPAKDEQEITRVRQSYFLDRNSAGEDGFVQAEREYAEYIREGRGSIAIHTPDPDFDNFVNHWLPRQMYYHGQTNRLTTDPQTRNYLQDQMGMSYIKPKMARAAFLTALSQQIVSGAMPDGIILHEEAELKYINQVPHTDHCVWLPVCLSTYLDETNDYGILEELVVFAESEEVASVHEHINRAMDWLLQARDERGLNYIDQGDWCDPMNMVGYKGKGVSGWLTIASAYAFMIWAEICERSGQLQNSEEYRLAAQETNAVINEYLWDGNWYARGITDDNVVFGISEDQEGRIYLNPQGWSLLSGAADLEKQQKLIRAVEEQLETPYGVEKLAPAYTAMREDVGRVTQKHPGTAENGSVYNHAAAFYIYALYAVGEREDAYRLLRKMLPGPDQEDILRRGQLPVFIPNYYRGAYRQIPHTAGRSSHLFNTGTVPWVYRCLIDGLFGLQGNREGLQVKPQLPADWQEASVTRWFRGVELQIEMKREAGVSATQVYVDGRHLVDGIIRDLNSDAGEVKVMVKLPVAEME
ncbi:GH36-type glycosyl hydrolase domain-containing protein [Paenibacillus donghaensis]|uniref:NdvB protein n=1 Tax=Paenibacillus donghaensis TaxID=414771 RepID=A0A2Z2KUP1_9BACL|nr:amylo-alpha-1,6-glucosidase [Paenibacillus donghaensis]ASA25832.1 NdvB protein [Paenibacillus donghaensis]